MSTLREQVADEVREATIHHFAKADVDYLTDRILALTEADAKRREREAFVQGYCAHAKYSGLWLPLKVPAEAEADYKRRYGEEVKA